MRVTFREGSTQLHRLNPVAKLFVLLAFCILAIFSRDILVQVAGLGAAFFLLLASGSAKAALRGVRSLLFLCLLLFLLQVAFVKTGRPLAGFEGSVLGMSVRIMVTSGGLIAGAMIAARLLIIILSSLVFVVTTDPAKLAYSLMQTGIPYRYGFMLVLALRFIPIFQTEASTVRRAQLARGLKIDSAGPRSLLAMARYTFTPLLVSALSRVETISTSMEARGFGISVSRTYLRTSEWGGADWLVSIGSISLMILGVAIAT